MNHVTLTDQPYIVAGQVEAKPEEPMPWGNSFEFEATCFCCFCFGFWLWFVFELGSHISQASLELSV